MFPRIITVRQGERTYRYLAIVESYREGGKTEQRQVGTLGNIDRYSPEEIVRIIERLRGFLADDPLGTVNDPNPQGAGVRSPVRGEYLLGPARPF